MSVSVIDVNNLDISLKSKEGNLNIVEDVTFNIAEGEIVGLVGESGSGKSITALSLAGLLPKDVYISKGSIKFNDIELSKLDNDSFSKIRGKKISMVFQEPMTSLNPVYTVGKQISECLELHSKLSRQEIKAQVINIMKKAGLSDAERLYYSYPHELSGGMRQRVMIAMAVILKPVLLIADEPTTALDVTIQAQILQLIKKINKEYKTSILFISHDLAVIKSLCDRVIVMYSGQIVEEAAASEIFKNPMHPYTKGLLECIPDRSKKGKVLFSIKGSIPELKRRNTEGCKFADRCINAEKRCFNERPGMVEISSSHKVRCFCEVQVRGDLLGK